MVTRAESSATFPPGAPVIRVDYHKPDELVKVFQGQDAVICAIGNTGHLGQKAMINAAEAAGVRRFILNDFGWDRDFRGIPEFDTILGGFRESSDYAKGKAAANPGFTYTGITISVCLDYVSATPYSSSPAQKTQLSRRCLTGTQALRSAPAIGFDMHNRSALIYDSGTEPFTAVTLHGLGQAVVGVLQNPAETANRFVRVRSVQTCQNEVLGTFEKVTGCKWDVRQATTKELYEAGRRKKEGGDMRWVADLIAMQLYEAGAGRSLVAPSWEESDSPMLGVAEETVEAIVEKAMKE